MDVSIAKMSTKGQIVIPKNLRGDFKPGEEFLVVRDEERIVLKRISSEKMKDDIKFSIAVEKAWKEVDKGKYISKSKEEFLQELKEWKEQITQRNLKNNFSK